MKVSAIISEFNPIHNGHSHLINYINQTHKNDGIISIMSGNFVQRGEPALIDKYSRAEMAVKAGCDIVLELPTVFALSSAENFALGAIKCLNSTNIVDSIYFGSDCGDIDYLTKMAKILSTESEIFKKSLKNNMNTGMSFANARNLAFKSLYSIDLSSGSNDILAIEYIKSIIRTNSSIHPFTLKRVGQYHNSLDISGSFISALSIRTQLKSSLNFDVLTESLSSTTLELIKNYSEHNKLCFIDDIFQYIKYKSLIENESSLLSIEDCTEGLENIILKSLRNSKNIYEALSLIKSKRYALSRLKRILTRYFLSMNKKDVTLALDSDINYLKILAFNENGRKILSILRKESTSKLLTNFNKHFEDNILNFDIVSSRAYSLLNPQYDFLSDYNLPPIYVKT